MLFSFPVYFVYALESADRQHQYFGITRDVKNRLAEHNVGKSVYTNKFKPWSLRLCITFRNHQRAQEFGQYLKSHSGRAFMKKHLHEKNMTVTRNIPELLFEQ